MKLSDVSTPDEPKERNRRTWLDRVSARMLTTGFVLMVIIEVSFWGDVVRIAATR